jgi:hypothetical protein
MASEKSYTITLSNNRTEKAAIDYVVASDPHFWVPSSAGSRRNILALMGLPASYSRAFDLVRVSDAAVTESELQVENVDNLMLIELKTTKKPLPESPKGFFFGATENEFQLARVLGDRFLFCFVCLHEDTPSYHLLTLAELEQMIRTKRVQYQINL